MTKGFFSSMGRALRYRNYRLFFSGQSISLTGTWMQRTALIWLVYRLTDSVAVMGLVDFVGQFPIFVFTPFAGVLLDRWHRYRVILVCQLLTMIQGLLFAFLILTDRVEVWQVLVLSLFLGIINAFDIPARQSFVVEVVDDRQDLGNAIALNSALFNSARIIGPSVAGLAIAMIGEGLCFLFNGLAHGATVVALLLMKLQPRPRKVLSGHIFRQLFDGMSYAWQVRPIRALLLILCITSFAGWPIMMIMPVFVGKILSGGPQTLGLLFTVFGFGALVATAWLASRRHTGGLERIIIRGGILFSLGLMVFSQSSWLWLSMVTIFVAGVGMVAQAASINTMLQTLVEEEKRGRLMSLYVMAFGGTVPLGSLAYGQVAAHIGAPMTVFAGAILCLIGTAVFQVSLPSWQAEAKRRLDENLL